MKIAIDESGDNGRKFWKGSSKWFILTAVIVPGDAFCGPTCQAVDKYRKSHNGGGELHFTHNSHEQHEDFLRYMHDYEFVFASIVIDKKRLLRQKPIVFSSKTSFVNYAFEELFDRLKPWLDSPKVLIDSNGSAHFNRGLSRHLIKMYGSRHKGDIHSIKQALMLDSGSEPLIQLADYVSGAIHHHIDEYHQSTTFEDTLEDKGKIYYI